MLTYSTKKSDYIFFLKSGHTLLKTVFRNVFFKHSIDFNSYQIIQPDREEFKEKQKFLFVRNPIDRFFSTYYFFEYNSSINLNSYIRDYNTNLEQTQNAHYKPQYKCLTTGKGTSYSSIDTCFNEEFGKYKIIKIEDIDSSMELFKTSLDFSIQKTGSSKFYDQEITFDFLNNENKLVSLDFILLYSYFKDYYEKIVRHHKNRDFLKEITKDQYEQVYSLLKDEMLFYGYEKHDLTKCKKNLI
jgi:hypothetical protein